MQVDQNDASSFLPKKSQDDVALWDDLTGRFHNLRDIVENTRLETKEEATGEKRSNGQWRDKAPTWDDEEIGEAVRAWNLLPYIDALNQNKIEEFIERAKRLIPDLSSCFENRTLTPAFLKMWGLFCSTAGVIEFIYFSETSVGHARSAYAGGKARADDAEAHCRWFSHYFLRVYSRGKRKEAQQMVEGLINGIIDGKISQPVGFDVHWFERFLNLDNKNSVEYGTLLPAFNEDSLSVKRMRGLIQEGTSGIPVTNLDFPDP